MKHKVVVYEYDSGLNELLKAQEKVWVARAKKYVVHNNEKAKNDKLCVKWIKRSGLDKVRIDNPVYMIYRFYVPNKKHDRSNYMSAFVKSFEDALQHCKVIKNDTYDLVLTPQIFFEIDRTNPRVEVEIIEVIKEKNK